MKAYITGLVTGVDVDEAIDALNAVSDLSRESCENLVRDLFVKGIARRTPVLEKAPPNDWYNFMCHFHYESWIPDKDDVSRPEALKLFRGSVPRKKNTGKKGKVNGREGIEILVLAFDEDEAFGYMVKYVKALGQLFNHVRPEHIFCVEVVGPFNSGNILAASPHPNGINSNWT